MDEDIRGVSPTFTPSQTTLAFCGSDVIHKKPYLPLPFPELTSIYAGFRITDC